MDFSFIRTLRARRPDIFGEAAGKALRNWKILIKAYQNNYGNFGD